jgi:hypothetical protein
MRAKKLFKITKLQKKHTNQSKSKNTIKQSIFIGLLLLLSISISLVTDLSLVKGSQSAKVLLTENLSFTTEFNNKVGVIPHLVSREFYVQVKNISPNEPHNLTVIFESQGTPGVVFPYGYKMGKINNYLYAVSVEINGTEGWIWFSPVLHKISSAPVVLSVLPLDTTAIQYIPGGWFTLHISLNITQAFDNTLLSVGIGDNTYTLLKYSRFNAGNRTFYFLIPTKNIGSKGVVSFQAFKSNSSCSIPVDVFLDGQRVRTETRTWYEIDQTFCAIPNSQINWYSGNCAIYLINFSSLTELNFRLDPEKREQICLIELESQIVDFNAFLTYAFDKPCYEVHISLDKPGKSYLGLGVLSKKWYGMEYLENETYVPQSIKERYLSPKGSSDGNYIDIDKQVVKLWVNQTVNSKLSPWNRCIVLFNNLTSTLKYNESLAKELPFEQETASATLIRKGGVCRHFARAYATLLLEAGVPVRTVVGTVVIGRPQIFKNHEWNEVYIGGFGWIPIDVTWNKTAELPVSHIQYTLLSYGEKTFNASEISSPILDNCSIKIISRLSELCTQKFIEVKSMPGALLLASDDLDNISILISQAKVEMNCGSLHSALLSLAEARALINSVQSGYTTYFVLVLVLVISALSLINVHKRKESRKRILYRPF